MGKGYEFDAEKVRLMIAEQGYSVTRYAETVLGWRAPQLQKLLKTGRARPETLDQLAYQLGCTIKDLMLQKVEVNKIEVMLDDGAKMPTRAHDTDAGLDLYAMDTVVIPPCGYGKLDTGCHVSIPKNHVGLVTSKSSLMLKGITCRGTIDCGYNGSIKAVLFNHGDLPVQIDRGQKITQLVILPIITPTPILVDSFEETDRGNGGFGSTGKF